MDDLLGKPVLASVEPSTRKRRRPASLIEFGKQYKISEPDLRMLESIEFRGEPPKNAGGWLIIYRAIRSGSTLGH